MNTSDGDLVATQTLKNTIAVIRGNKNKWKMISETKLIDGKVNTMILTPDGSKLIYDIVKEQRQEIFLLYVDTNSLSRITSLKRTSNFIKIATNFQTGIAIIFQENADALKVSFKRLNNRHCTKILNSTFNYFFYVILLLGYFF